MAVNLSPVAGVAGQLFDNNGDPLTGGKIFTYAAGTTTNQTTYTNASGGVPHSNPIILDAAGRVPSGEIWLTDGSVYKFVITDSSNVLIGTYDNVSGINSNFVNFVNQQEIQTATAGQTVFTLATTQYQPGTNSLSVFVDGVNQYGPGAQYAYFETSSTVITFVTGLHVGAEVKFTTSQINSSAATSADQVSYTPAGVGAVPTNVQSKLREIVSVQDFGAVGDGVTNNIAAFIAAAAALDDGDSLFIPNGDYIFNFSTYTVVSPVYPTQGIINLVNKQGIKIYGTGAKLRITNLNTQTKGGWSIINLDNSSEVEISGLSFDVRGVTGITASAPEPNYPIISCVFASGLTWKNLLVDNCKFTSFNPLGAEESTSASDFYYKQIPIYIGGDTNANAVRGFTFTNNIVGDGLSDMNTYKIFLFGVGGVNISNNRFLNICGSFPTIRNLVHASSGHVVEGNYFEGLDPADDDPANNIVSTDTPQMVSYSNATNKGGGGGSISNNTFALTGSGGVSISDFAGCSIQANAFWDRVDMSSVFTIENDIVACIRLTDEATGSGSFPSRGIAITGNSNKGTITRKAIQITHSANGSISNNNFQNCAGYAIKAARARRFVISDNTIVAVNLFVAIQIAIEAVATNLASGETVLIFNNRIFGSAGVAIASSSYTPDKIFINNNYTNGGMTALQAGLQDQLTTNFISFGNDATRVSTATNALDWYEEGVFTPVIVGGTSAGVGTYTTQIGKFTRVGDLVHFQISIVWTAHTGTGNTQIQFLPYAPESTSGEVMLTDIIQNGGPIPAAGSIRIAVIEPGSTTVGLREQVLASMTITNTNPITATGTIFVSGLYKV